MSHGKFYLNIINFFSSSHVIPNHPGKCRRLHGHNYKLITEVSTTLLDDMGMVVEKGDLSELVENIVQQIDHYHINDLPDFSDTIPTAENIARWFYKKIKSSLSTHLELESVTLWETDHFFVRYVENDR